MKKKKRGKKIEGLVGPAGRKDRSQSREIGEQRTEISKGNNRKGNHASNRKIGKRKIEGDRKPRNERKGRKESVITLDVKKRLKERK